MQPSDTCTACGGTGHTDSWCQTCGGKGQIPLGHDWPSPLSFYQFLAVLASLCNSLCNSLGSMVDCGDCVEGKEKCSTCGGTGRVHA